MTDKPEPDRPIKLNEAEEDIVGRHRDRIERLVDDLSKILKKDQRWWSDSPLEKPRYPPADFKQPRKATTLAVLGPRGSGKTTCMVSLLEELEEKTADDDVNQRKGCIRPLADFHPVDQVVDCSLGSQNVPFGLSVLMRVRHLLGLHRDPSETSAWSCRGEVRVEPKAEAEQRAFKVLREAYMLNRPAAARVLEGTSSSGAHFAKQASSAAGQALSLPDRVADWLQCAANCCGPDVEGFVVILDDVDLARDGILDMVYSLLDELHQPRLILMIGADLPTLERRIADSLARGGLNRRHPGSEEPVRRSLEEEVRMANDLLYKILPQVNREWLLPWTEEDRWSFPPRPAAAYELDSSLGELLSRKDWGPAFRIPALLPEYPRHLENLWRALARPQQEPKEDGSERTSFKDRAEFIAYLAEARGDYGLARRVPLRIPDEWGRTFSWEEPIAAGMWDRLVEAALESTPLAGFSAASDDLPMPESPSSAALWTELLLDLSLASGQLTSAELIRRFPRMNGLIDRSQIRTDFHREEMTDQLCNARGSIMAQLAWTRFDVVLDRNGVLPEEFDARVGFAPLREAAEGGRDLWPTSLLQGLYLQRSKVLDERQQAYGKDGTSDDANALLPRAVRPLIVFVDSLSRAPWGLLSETPRRRSLRTNALVVAGLVRAAYVDALDRMFHALSGRGYVNKTVKRAEADVAWQDEIHDRGSTPIVEWSDDDIEGRFHALLKEKIPYRKLTFKDLPKKHAERVDWEFVFAPYNELVRCLNAYTKSRAFRHLADPDFH